MDGWLALLAGGVLGGGGLGAVLVFVATRKKDKATVVSERWDDASELATYIRGEIDKAVEKAVLPLESRIQALESEKREVHDAVRTRETRLWLWDIRNRPGPIPELPASVLEKLNLAHLTFASGGSEGAAP